MARQWVTPSGVLVQEIATRQYVVGGGLVQATTVVVGSTGQIKAYSGSAFLAKPMKVWSGSAWVRKPVKRWSGSAWVPTNY